MEDEKRNMKLKEFKDGDRVRKKEGMIEVWCQHYIKV